jgi:hypothetical protein
MDLGNGEDMSAPAADGVPRTAAIAWQGHVPAVQALYEHLEVMRQEHDLNFAQMTRILDFAYRLEAEVAQPAPGLDAHDACEREQERLGRLLDDCEREYARLRGGDRG